MSRARSARASSFVTSIPPSPVVLVFDDRDPASVELTDELADRHRASAYMDHDDGFRARRDSLDDELRRGVEIGRIDVDEDGCRPSVHDHLAACGEGPGGHDHLVARADAQAFERE